METITILCVDDESCILSLIKRLLRKEPYEVILMEKGEEAIDCMKKNEIALVISDYKMPGMSGLEFLREARRISPNTQRIFITAFADLDVVQTAVNELEVFRYFLKPWDNNEFLLAIREAVEKYKRIAKSI